MDYKENNEETSTNLRHTTEEHTKYSCCEDEYVAEEQEVWFA